VTEIFKPGREPYGNYPNLSTHPAAPSSIIRRVHTARGESFEAARLSKALHTELTDAFHIPVVPYGAVIDSAHSYWCVAENIDGISIEGENGERREAPVTRADLTDEQYLSAQRLHEQQYDYLMHKIATKEPFLEDIFTLSQFIYAPDGNWTLVDIDPYICPGSEKTGVLGRLQAEMLTCAEYAGSVTRLFLQDTAIKAGWEMKLETLMKAAFVASGMDAESPAIEQVLSLVTDIGHMNEEEALWFDETVVWQLVLAAYTDSIG
jgi:hypothetical protein